MSYGIREKLYMESIRNYIVEVSLSYLASRSKKIRYKTDRSLKRGEGFAIGNRILFDEEKGESFRL